MCSGSECHVVLTICFPGEGGFEKILTLLRTLGESFQVFEIGSGNFRETKVEDQSEGDVELGHLDRLAVLIRGRKSVGEMPLYIAIYLPLRLFHGRRAAEGAIRISAGAIGGRNRESLVEDREGGNNRPWRFGESDGHRGETKNDFIKRLFRCVIF